MAEWIRAGLVAVAVVLLSTAVSAPADSPARDARREVSRDADGRPTGTRLLRSWRETVKIDASDVPRFVEVVYDYETGVARRRSFDAEGALVDDRALADQPQPSAEEIADAISRIRADAEYGRWLRAAGADINGGFVLVEREGRPCGPGSRCLQFIVRSPALSESHRRPVIDMREERFAHRNYRAERSE